MVSFGATAAGLFEPVNVYLTFVCNKQDQLGMVAFFHGVIPDAFEVRRIVCVEN